MESLSAVVLDMSMPREYSPSSSPSHGSLLPSGSSSAGSSSPVSANRLRREPLTLVQMLLLNAAVCGVEICACAGFTYIPPMLLKAGFSEENMSFLLGLGPLLGFLFVPIIGRASDRCYSPMGRRRPFIMGLSILLVVSLYLIPFGEYFASLVVAVPSTGKSVGIWALTIGVVLLDFTTQACLTPIEAMLNDVTRDSDQNEKIFTIYSFMISMGGIMGYLLTAIDWTSNPLGEYFGGQEASIFSILIFIFTMFLSATLMAAQEVPLPRPTVDGTHLAAIKSASPASSPSMSSLGNGASNSSISYPQSQMMDKDPGYTSTESSPDHQMHRNFGADCSSKRDLRTSVYIHSRKYGALSCRSVQRYVKKTFHKAMSCLPYNGRYITNSLQGLAWFGQYLFPNQLVQLFEIPLVLKYLALADFFSWTAIMAFNIYYTDYVGQIVYGGNPNADETSPEGRAYDEGVRTASWGLLLHCICSAFVSFFIERLTAVYGYKQTFTFGMLSFVAAMMGMVLIHHIFFVNLMAAVTGFAYATITTIPFMLVSKYHNNKKIYFADMPSIASSDSERGIGADMAVLDWSYFLSQVVLTVTMGAIVHVTGTLVSYMVTAGTMGILAIYYIGKVVENEAQARRCISAR